jgi:hypothetical protein
VTSVLVSLESQLGPQRAEKSEPCNDVVQRTMQDESQLLTLLHMVFYTISTAMRFEPANAKYFHHEVYWKRIVIMPLLPVLKFIF